MNNENFSLTHAWAFALAGDPDNTVFNWRFIHDQDRGKPGIKRRGTIAAIWSEACSWNERGYGIFATVNEMDGTGYDANGQPLRDAESGDTLTHVAAIRAHVVDLDNLSAMENLQRANAHFPAPQFAVYSSPGKAHVYWVVNRYRDNEFYRLQQRKLRQLFDGDPGVIDATRVLRVPGFYHRKGNPHLVTCSSLNGYGYQTDLSALVQSIAHINAVDDFHERKPLGDPSLAGPSREWVIEALYSMPVDGLDHPSFISFLAAWKQAASTVLESNEARDLFLQWCSHIPGHKGFEHDLKHWDSITQTELGWKSLLRQNPTLNAKFLFHGTNHVPQVQGQAQIAAPIAHAEIPQLMFAEDYKDYFKGCTFVTQFGEILDPKGQLLNSTQFNGTYGGPRFVISPQGQPSNEPWTAATRSVFWRIPTVDYLRFLPHEQPGKIVSDELGRTGVNLYKPAIILRMAGDPAPFYHHLGLIMPNTDDQQIFLKYIAHNAQYPGYKIPWAPLIQSVEGAGKGVFKTLFSYLVGSAYFHSPAAKELTDGGAKFNAWMRGKLFILVDEIKTDERRDMIEVLKPWISEEQIEIQGKGHDQRKEDNYSNWAFFSNYKDAVPINQNSRRFSIFYSSIQSVADLEIREMNDRYYTWLYGWLKGDGCAILAHHFMNDFMLERGAIPMRAPRTSSHNEAIHHGRSPAERAVLDAIEANYPGFRGGWISTVAATSRIRAAGLRALSQNGIERMIEGLGFHRIGKAERAFFQEENGVTVPVLFNAERGASVRGYSTAQGYGA